MARILVVEDDGEMQVLIRRVLLGGGHQVVLAVDAREAVAHLEAGPFDMILLDQELPVMSGIDFARLLQDSPRLTGLQQTPVVMVTGSDAPGLMSESFEAGAAYFLSKPFSPNELLSTVRLVVAAGA